MSKSSLIPFVIQYDSYSNSNSWFKVKITNSEWSDDSLSALKFLSESNLKRESVWMNNQRRDWSTVVKLVVQPSWLLGPRLLNNVLLKIWLDSNFIPQFLKTKSEKSRGEITWPSYYSKKGNFRFLGKKFESDKN